MCKTSSVRDEVTTPLLPKLSHHDKPHLLKNHSPPLSLFANEAISIAKISLPLVFTGLLLYFRSFVSLFFLGGLGRPTLAGGSLALAFANITGYSLFSGLTMGVESICSQAFGAKRYNLVHSTIRRGVVLLLLTSLPVSLLWINIVKILEMLKQDEDLASEAHTFLLYSVPDLLAQSFLHPLRVYLRTQSKTLPLSICTAVASVLHLPITFLLVSYLGFGIKGIALSGVVSNFNLVLFLFVYIRFLEDKKRIDEEVLEEEEEVGDGMREWKKLLALALPSCVSVCLEWWCYEIMILLCGFLVNPKATVASMGILIQITSLVYIFPSSLSFGVSTRVGNELGSNRPKRARRAAVVGLGLSIALGFTALAFTVSVRNIWARLFTDDEEIVRSTLMALPIVGLCELGNCPQTTGCGVLRGSARPRIGANVNMAAFYVVGMPVGVVLAFWFGFGFRGLWLGMLAAQMSCVIGMMVATCRTNWELEAERAKELTAVDGVSSGDGVDVEVGKVDK
ncbi:MATE efflux family protein [Raphanus sativus]|uniref:Protein DETOXIFICATION n=1 Tax=Raphanus sativus TaxID=3726 RepID=A0A6J0MM44_RAPSA|nr:protein DETOXIFICATION 50 [Raphanus sativus]KAJ4907508.1 MATE efflux family protein [Raphanus sativus]